MVRTFQTYSQARVILTRYGPQSGLTKMLAQSPAEESMLASLNFSAPLAESEGVNSASIPLGTPPLYDVSHLSVPRRVHSGLSSAVDDPEDIMRSGTPTERDAHLATGRFSGRANLDDVPEAAGGLPGNRTPSPQRSPHRTTTSIAPVPIVGASAKA